MGRIIGSKIRVIKPGKGEHGCGYAAVVDLWITLQGQGYPQAPQLLGQHCVLPTYPQPLLLKRFYIFKDQKNILIILAILIQPLLLLILLFPKRFKEKA
jgi:hypothetical protein